MSCYRKGAAVYRLDRTGYEKTKKNLTSGKMSKYMKGKRRQVEIRKEGRNRRFVPE